MQDKELRMMGEWYHAVCLEKAADYIDSLTEDSPEAKREALAKKGEEIGVEAELIKRFRKDPATYCVALCIEIGGNLLL